MHFTVLNHPQSSPQGVTILPILQLGKMRLGFETKLSYLIYSASLEISRGFNHLPLDLVQTSTGCILLAFSPAGIPTIKSLLTGCRRNDVSVSSAWLARDGNKKLFFSSRSVSIPWGMQKPHLGTFPFLIPLPTLLGSS